MEQDYSQIVKQEMTINPSEARKGAYMYALSQLLTTKQLASLAELAMKSSKESLETRMVLLQSISDAPQVKVVRTNQLTRGNRRKLGQSFQTERELQNLWGNLLGESYTRVSADFDQTIIPKIGQIEPAQELIETARVATELYSINEADLYPTRQDTLRQTTLSLLTYGRIELLAFACPLIDPSYLAWDSSELSYYIETSSAGSALLINASRFLPILRWFNELDIPVRLTVLLADGRSGIGDEYEYVFPIIEKDISANIKPVISQRFKAQREDLERRLGKVAMKYKVPSSTIKVERVSKYVNSIDLKNPISWPRWLGQEGRDILQQTLNKFQESPPGILIEEEEPIMRSILDWYYKGKLGNLPEDVIREIARQKIISYGLEGISLMLQQPFSTLIQLESPPDLRTNMLNATVRNSLLDGQTTTSSQNYARNLLINLAMPAIS